MAQSITSSAPLERDARAVNTRDDHGVNPGEIAIGVIIGRTSEFFDSFVYAIASVLVFPQIVFPQLDRVSGTLWSFGLFSLAFIARPIGTQIFMRIDRELGRGTKLTIALFLLGTATVAMAFLPGYASDMQGSKAVHLRDWAAAQGRAFLRFDYSGHGESGGDGGEDARRGGAHAGSRRKRPKPPFSLSEVEGHGIAPAA